MAYSFEEYLNKHPHIKELCKKNPEYKDELLAYREKHIQTTLRLMLEQTRYGRFTLVNVQRNGCAVTITWRFPKFDQTATDYKVIGQIREMSLIPDSNHDMDSMIIDQHGAGSCRLDLAEGRSYLVVMHIHNDAEIEKMGTPEFDKQHTDCVSFHVAVPLSDENKRVLDEIDLHPEKRVKHAMGKFLDLTDTFDEELRSGIERIKKKKLSPEDENEQISRFVEHTAQLKERTGL